jgi:putative FmdB family regulatory protein
MPIYTYKCDNCGRTFDMMVKPGENGRVNCIYCKAQARRVFSPVGIIFKGSGFYSTDYKKGSNTPSASREVSEDNVKEKTGDESVEKSKSGSGEKNKNTDKDKVDSTRNK